MRRAIIPVARPGRTVADQTLQGTKPVQARGQQVFFAQGRDASANEELSGEQKIVIAAKLHAAAAAAVATFGVLLLTLSGGD